MVITIDGPAGAGKSTVARRTAAALGLPYLPSGAIYRALTLLVLESAGSSAGGDFANRELVRRLISDLDLRFETPPGAEETRVFLAGRDVTAQLRDPQVTAQTSRIADVGEYRALLVDYQRRFARPRGLVCEGRDMGTVIFPQADLKIYMDASAEARARRRQSELSAQGVRASYEEVLSAMRARDERDRGRGAAPLRVPEGAVVIHTDDMSATEVVAEILSHVPKKEA